MLVIPSATKGRKSEQDRRTSYLFGIKNPCITVNTTQLTAIQVYKEPQGRLSEWLCPDIHSRAPV